MSLRKSLFIGATVLLWSCAAPPAAGKYQTQNVFLISIDGLRWNELFSGADSILLFTDRGGVKDSALMVDQFWRDNPGSRREALMPFFWQQLAADGIVYGNRLLGSEAEVANSYQVSAPGYAEIFTGIAHTGISDNSRKQISATTIFEFVRDELLLSETQVAAFTSWDLFPYLVSKESGSIYVNAGFDAVRDEPLTTEQRLMNRLQKTLPKQWNDVRYDGLTFYQGMEFIKKYEPKFTYFSFGETDDWSHSGRYDQVLLAAHRIDGFLRELSEWITSNNHYRDKTTIIITSDHGRGDNSSQKWRSHGSSIIEAGHTWIAVIGPDTPNIGELSDRPVVQQQQIAATIANLFGLNFSKVDTRVSAVLPMALRTDH